VARPQSVAGGRPVRVTVNLSEDEVARLDRLRGSLSRAEFLRVLMQSIENAQKG